jgi:hydrogenase-4 component F
MPSLLFMVGQPIKAVAYSSVEHMGILALGLGSAGPLLRNASARRAERPRQRRVFSRRQPPSRYGRQAYRQVRAAMRRLPLPAALFVGFYAITGSAIGPSSAVLISSAPRRRPARYWRSLTLPALAVFIGLGATSE